MVREPKYSVLGWLGSTIRRSPTERPSALPPIGSVIVVAVNVRP